MVIVKCVGERKNITIGNKYNILDEDKHCIRIINDKNEEDWYYKEYFKRVIKINIKHRR
jgi:hypothetical protein